jgi:hypothetical protein
VTLGCFHWCLHSCAHHTSMPLRRTVASDIKICCSMPSAKTGSLLSNESRAKSTRDLHTSPHAKLLPAFRSLGRPVKLAFVTPFPPRHDGLSQYSAHLRTSLLAQCSDLQVSSCACSGNVSGS